MHKWQDQHAVSAVKEAYTIFDNALKMAIRENLYIPKYQTYFSLN